MAVGARRDRYLLAVGLVVLTIVVAAFAADGGWGRVLWIAVEGGTLLFILRTSAVRRWAMIAAAALVMAAIGLNVVLAPVGGRVATGIGVALGASLALLAPAAIVRRLLQHDRITTHTIFGALCIYLLAGLFFALVFTAVGTFEREGFFAQQRTAHVIDYLYFSFVTLATLGYGDLTPRGNLSRMLAVVEALVGQLYLISVVALLVSNMGGRLPRRPH